MTVRLLEELCAEDLSLAGGPQDVPKAVLEPTDNRSGELGGSNRCAAEAQRNRYFSGTSRSVRREAQHALWLAWPSAGQLEQLNGVPVPPIQVELIAGLQLGRSSQDLLVDTTIRISERDQRLHTLIVRPRGTEVAQRAGSACLRTSSKLSSKPADDRLGVLSVVQEGV